MMLEYVAGVEGVGRRTVERNVRDGSLVLVKNARRRIRPLAVGAGVSTKVNANIGVSPERKSLRQELEKARVAVEFGADTLMDLSVDGAVDKIRRRIMREARVPLGTVPIYQVYGEKRLDFTLDDYLRVLERQCRDGVDFVTIHAGVTREAVRQAGKRIIPITSRGGCFLAAWMRKHKSENPLYTGYEEVLDVLKEYEVTISLGDGLRPACIRDATDKAQLTELKTLGRLTKAAWKAGVKVIVEGPGHVPLDQIEYNMRVQKRICGNAPFYVLGPLVTDVGVGHDHITGAIGGALAAVHGADFLCYVTPSEHLGLPTVEDVKEGVIASKIAAHAADIVKLGRTARDERMSRARARLDWGGMFKNALDHSVREKYPHLRNRRECTMCGKYCALRVSKGF